MADDKAQEQQQKQQQQQQEKTQDHIPMTNQENNNADGDAKQSQPGLLSKIGDPAGTHKKVPTCLLTYIPTSFIILIG